MRFLGSLARRWWLAALAGALLVFVGSQQIWVTGSWQDPVLGTSALEVTGSQAGGTLTAGALLAGAALLAGLVGSRPVRLAAAVCLAGGAALVSGPALRAVTDPGGVGQDLVAEQPGAAGLTVEVLDATATAWPWLALGGAVLILLGALGAALWWWLSAPSRTSTATQRAGRPRQARPVDPWDQLTRGDDPTVDD